jgi:hypothetical protein
MKIRVFKIRVSTKTWSHEYMAAAKDSMGAVMRAMDVWGATTCKIDATPVR